MKLCVGRYTSGSSLPGIYLFDMDDVSGKLHLLSTSSKSENPSFIAMDEKRLYAVNEMLNQGYIDTYTWKNNHRDLEFINRFAIDASAMCHINLWENKKIISVANYMSGSFDICTLDNQGIPISVVEHVYYDGVGADCLGRQESSHIHSTIMSPANDRIIVADLGLDQLISYKINFTTGQIISNSDIISLPDGEGPRHMVFSPNGHFFYVITELKNHIYVYEYKEETGFSEIIQCVSTLPKDFHGENLAADIHLTDDGRFLYVSNRGNNDIVAFEINIATGQLNLVGHYPVNGKGIRSFCISPNQMFMIVACQDTGSILVYKRNVDTGQLGELVTQTTIQQASFVKIW